MEAINKIFQKIEVAGSINIILPMPADTDAVVSAYLIDYWITELGKKSVIISQAKLSDFLVRIIGNDRFFISSQFSTADLYIIVDCPSLRHTGFVDEIAKLDREKIILIDHHEISDLSKNVGLAYRDSNWSSAAEGVYYLLAIYKKIKPREATLLLLAVMADTGRFQFNLSGQTLILISKLLSLGANLRFASLYYDSTKRSISELQLWGEVLQNLKFIEKWNLVIAQVNQKILSNLQLDENAAEGIAGFLISQNIADLIIVLIEQPDGRVRGLVRSSDRRRSAGQIAKLFGGDGFDRAGGFLVKPEKEVRS